MAQITAVNAKIDTLNHSVTTKMSSITNSVKEIDSHQTDYRNIHDTRMQSIITLTNKMFSELIDETNQ